MAASLFVRDLCFLENGPYSLSVGSGECVGMTGPSGVGKTQFLKAIVDIIPHSGELSLDGIDCNEMSAPEWRKRLSLIPSESRWWYDRVSDHFPIDFLETAQAQWFHKLGFTDDTINWQVSRLSTGEKQRLSFVRAMINEPSLLLLDEPTSSLDHHHTTKLENLLCELCSRQQLGLLWVSHDIAQLQRVCDRIYKVEKKTLQLLENS